MSEPKSDAEIDVSSEDITAFAGRLSNWSQSLGPAEQSLAQVLVQYARDLRPEDVRRQQFVNEFDEATRATIRSTRERWSKLDAPTAWVETGPVWQKANTVEGREEWEIVQWTYTRPQKWTPPYA